MTVQEYIHNRYSKYIQSDIKENPCIKNGKNDIKYTNYQKFLEDYASSVLVKERNKGILLYHKVGSGKTISSILMTEQILQKGDYKKAIVILPASLRNNYSTELEKIKGVKTDNYTHHS